MKSFKLLALLAVLGLGACSVSDGKFLDQVKGKTVYTDETGQTDANKYGTFSTDGKTFNQTFGTSIAYKFDSASDENTAIYKIETTEITFKVDGKKLTLTGAPTLYFGN